MTTFEFSLNYCVIDGTGDVDEMVEVLGKGGCNDALIGMGRSGYLAMMFTRYEAYTIFDIYAHAPYYYLQYTRHASL